MPKWSCWSGVLLLVAIARAQDCQPMPLGALGGSPNDVRVRGTTAYVAHGAGGFYVYDVFDPAWPEALSIQTTSGWASAVEIAGDFAFVGSHLGIDVFEIGDPRDPQYLGLYSTAAPVSEVVYDSGRLYVSAQEMLILDASDPARLTLLSATPASPGLIVVRENLVYATGADSLKIYDVSSPGAPFLVGTLQMNAPWGLAVTGDVAYVADWHRGWVVVDVSDPSQPTVMSDHAGYLDEVSIIEVAGASAYVVATSGLHIFDVTDPLAPLEQGGLWTGFGVGLTVANGSAYFAGDRGLSIVDVTNPAAPVEIGLAGAVGFIEEVAISGSLAYLGGRGGFQVVDFSDPLAPMPIGWTADPASMGIELSEHYAFLAAESLGVTVLDVSNPSRPVPVGTYWNAISYVKDIAIEADRAYVVDTFEGLVTLDVSDPTHPQLLGQYPVASPSDVAVARGIALVGTTVPSPGLLLVIDVSDPVQPVLLASLPMSTSDIAVADDIAYVGKTNGLQLVDLSDPTAPALLGSCAVPQAVFGVTVSGHLTYLGCRHAGLQVVDVSNPHAPRIIGSHDTPGYSKGVAYADGLVALADRFTLQFIDVNECSQCAADLNGDGRVCQGDLGLLLDSYGCAGRACPGDVDADGDTDQADLGALLAQYDACGAPCAP